MQPELYEDRFFLPLLWAKVRLGDWMLPKDPARALETYEAVRKAYPDAVLDSRFAYHLGLAFYTTGRRGEAARVWDELLKSKPAADIDAFVRFYMGELHREAGRPEEAARYYRMALAASPPPELKKAIEERLSGH
jgi:tetratricopeptide (TPR) repeat protein